MGNKQLSLAHYYKNKEQYKARNQARAQLFRSIVQLAKSIPCVDCGCIYPYYVMDFDHRDAQDKCFTIGQLGFCSSERRLRNEIAKCDVVCSNCHRIRTYASKIKGTVS
jgi:hypothetical protein